MNTVTLTEEDIKLIAVDVVDHYLNYSGEPDGSNLDLLEVTQYYVLGEADILRLVNRVFGEAAEMLMEEKGEIE